MGPLKLSEWSPDVLPLLLKCMPIFKREQFSILVSKEAERHWTAHCLEMDMVSDGDSMKAAVANVVVSMAIVLEDYIDGVVSGTYFSPAPKEHWARMDGADNFEIIVEVKKPKSRPLVTNRRAGSRQVLRGRRLATQNCQV
ncbi:hypothetical protein KQI63_09730 [bacterium]|nr:hypothetical protein [bacterium]